LGLPQVDVPFDQLQDPEAIANWPHTLSRDGARTPMPWTANAANLGFSSGTPWLPVGNNHRALAVDRQERPGSMLDFTRQCMALRSKHGALRTGAMEIREADDALLVFDRLLGSQRIRCTFNLSEGPRPLASSGRGLLSTGPVDGNSVGPYGAIIEEIS
jgi:alpha-glucosidase